jgi:hypothetical protein
MTVPTVVGGILTVFGLAFLVRGVGGLFGIFAVGIASPDLDPITKLIDAITGLVTALTKAPTWLAATIIGVILVLLGAWIGGWLPVPHTVA